MNKGREIILLIVIAAVAVVGYLLCLGGFQEIMTGVI